MIFRAVASFYDKWYDVPDREVVELMEAAAENGILAKPEKEQ